MLDTPYKVNAMFGTQLTEMDTLFTIDVLYQRNISAQKKGCKKWVMQHFPLIKGIVLEYLNLFLFLLKYNDAFWILIYLEKNIKL